MTIAISAGHHPSRPGACYKGFCEHPEAVLWATLVVDLLGYQHAVQVPPGTLREKVGFINGLGCEAAVEIHFNSAVDRDGNRVGEGSETLYYPGSARGRELAERLQSAIAPHFPPDRGVKEGWYRMDPSKGPDYFLARTRCPAVILEPEFIHHVERIRSRRDAACAAIAAALLVDER